MILPFIYMSIIIGWGLLLFGYYIEDYTIISLACILLLVAGVYILINGIEDISNLATDTFGIIQIALGTIIWLKASYEEYKTM